MRAFARFLLLAYTLVFLPAQAQTVAGLCVAHVQGAFSVAAMADQADLPHCHQHDSGSPESSMDCGHTCSACQGFMAAGMLMSMPTLAAPQPSEPTAEPVVFLVSVVARPPLRPPISHA